MDSADSNWVLYFEKVSECEDALYEENSIVLNEDLLQEQLSTLQSFFDIYENDICNQDILDLFNSSKYSTQGISTIDIFELTLLLPYTSRLAETYETNRITAYRSYDVEKAVAYAIQYATSPNSLGYGYFFDADCTNFVSQAKYNGGVSMDITNNSSTGWWHKLNEVHSYHTYSNSWTVADTYVKYFGVKTKTKSLSTFSSALNLGDVVAYDRENDGSWNHCGFVVDKDSTTGTYDGKTFIDFKIAQHTSNYCRWASSSNNNWDNLESTAYYAVVYV